MTDWTALDQANVADGHYACKRRPDWLTTAKQDAERAGKLHMELCDAYEAGDCEIGTVLAAEELAAALDAYYRDLLQIWQSGGIPASIQVRLPVSL